MHVAKAGSVGDLLQHKIGVDPDLKPLQKRKDFQDLLAPPATP